MDMSSLSSHLPPSHRRRQQQQQQQQGGAPGSLNGGRPIARARPCTRTRTSSTQTTSPLSPSTPSSARAEADLTKAFKHAALSLTTLYKASQRSRREGYLDCLDELYDRFLSGGVAGDESDDVRTVTEVDVKRLVQYVSENRRAAYMAAVEEDEEDEDGEGEDEGGEEEDDVEGMTESIVTETPSTPRNPKRQTQTPITDIPPHHNDHHKRHRFT
ncbi:hypothetical protein PYCC9005_001694 [Savitreella phatthalungensis]